MRSSFKPFAFSSADNDSGKSCGSVGINDLARLSSERTSFTASHGRRLFHQSTGGALSDLVTNHHHCFVELSGNFFAGSLAFKDGVGDQDVVRDIAGVLLFAARMPLITIQENLPANRG